MKKLITYFTRLTLLFIFHVVSLSCSEIDINITNERLLVVSTLDGHLTALSADTGKIAWRLDELPVLKVPFSVRAGFSFLPDPRDGTLYALGDGKLKKLPFTLPQLVQASPCKSADGILYAGRKHDVWFGLNPKTGEKSESFNSDASEKVCPASDENMVYVGRTEYQLSMFDGKSRTKRWNATFLDYSSYILPEDFNYPFQHYSSSFGGRLVTVDSETGEILWERDFASVVVSVYLLENKGLHRVPFTVIGKQTLDNLLSSFYDSDIPANENAKYPWKFMFKNHKDKVVLNPALFIGEFKNGLYAMPSLVDDSTATIVPKSGGLPLLPGPSPITADEPSVKTNKQQKFVTVDFDVAKLYSGNTDQEILLLGYHEIPETLESMTLHHPHSLQNRPALPYTRAVSTNRNGSGSSASNSSQAESTTSYVYLHQNSFFVSDLWKMVVTSILTGTFVVVVSLFFLRKIIIKTVAAHSRSMETSRSDPYMRNGTVDFADSSFVHIGKIAFNPQRILGRGCEGTVVYKGVFDGRDVAVKRVVSDFFNLADREVDLLRVSDSHPNVIRYFCMESDSQFRYIALELCWATLNDYVENIEVREKCPLKPIYILEQATIGLAHLHSLKIVHRDLKPHNILLSQPNVNSRGNVVISDFGLCKKLTAGRNSFSKRSGFAGTDGWIAPEMFHSCHATCAVDIFSLGCVFYYVLSLGKHPFGDSFRRQGNIDAGTYDLSGLMGVGDDCCCHLIESMINCDPPQRPKADVVLAHPFFWSNAKKIAFFQEVSDRADKEDSQNPIVQRLEKGCWSVVNKDWRLHIDDCLVADLKARRSYRGNSVRDLLRAMRNKKNHFRELPEEVRNMFGDVPEELVAYFTSRFPKLLIHVYDSMKICQTEPSFGPYYHLI